MNGADGSGLVRSKGKRGEAARKLFQQAIGDRRRFGTLEHDQATTGPLRLNPNVPAVCKISDVRNEDGTNRSFSEFRLDVDDSGPCPGGPESEEILLFNHATQCRISLRMHVPNG